MSAMKRQDVKTVRGFTFQIPIFYKLMVSMLFVATIPMILLYLFGQRLFVEGLVAGAVK